MISSLTRQDNNSGLSDFGNRGDLNPYVVKYLRYRLGGVVSMWIMWCAQPSSYLALGRLMSRHSLKENEGA